MLKGEPSVKFESWYRKFLPRKCTWKYGLQNIGRFVGPWYVKKHAMGNSWQAMNILMLLWLCETVCLTKWLYYLVASPMSLWLLWWSPTGSSMFRVVVLLHICSVLHCLYSVGNEITTTTKKILLSYTSFRRICDFSLGNGDSGHTQIPIQQKLFWAGKLQ